MRAPVALVLHAHLPWVREERPWSASERWFHEALWECYLPLVAMADRLAADGVRAPSTLSVSPPLAGMLRDPLLAKRFEAHLDALDALDARHGGGYREPLTNARATWSRHRGDLLGALAAHAGAGQLELVTTSASHAFLPALARVPGAAEAQMAIGAASFAALTSLPPPVARWLPECGVDAGVVRALATVGVRAAVVDASSAEHAAPRPEPLAPFVSPEGVVCFPRDRAACDRVWARAWGYPGHPSYREFFRDVGHDLAAEELFPFGQGEMTGVKPWAIGVVGEPPVRYDPDRGRAQALRDAEDFVERLRERAAVRASERGVVVVAFDAELFGHWWFEGPIFLERVLRLLADDDRLEPVSLGGYLARWPRHPVAEPGAGSWGEGGTFRTWVGPGTARHWRLIHGCHRAVTAAARSAGARMADAVRELLLLEASDWLFMIANQSCADYAARRIEAHAARVVELLAGRGAGPSSGYLAELEDERLVELLVR